MNIPTRVGFQTPFTNVSFDVRPPDALANEPIIIGGQMQQETYSELQFMPLFSHILLFCFKREFFCYNL